MGNAQSPEGANPRFTSAIRSFSEKELSDLKSLFESLAAQSQSEGHYISISVFKAYTGIKGPLADRLYDLVSQNRKDDKLTFQDLIIAKGTYEKGTRDEIDEFLYQLCDVDGDGNLVRSDLEAVISEILDNVLPVKKSEPSSVSDPKSISIFLDASKFTKDNEGSSEKSMSFEDFRNWCRLIPSARKFLVTLLKPTSDTQVPHLVYQDDIDSSMLLLKEEYAWHIGGALSHQELDEWKLMYHSAFNGLSFNTFLGNISNAEGPTVLIIKDKEGYIYGGYASQPWERHADFYGDMKTFLFQLYPTASIYRPTGANNNIQWCAVNFSSDSIPNGIGFGGRTSHFNLFISSNFDNGHTFTGPTFNNPCLSKNNHIYPEVIECWGVVPKGGQQEKQDGIKGTVLDRFKEDRNMLNLVGLANSSN
uniref:MTOR-associated protein MEAK7 isoform X2 n=1 Tax=Erigeron canadensis TaxID=72917 RepID=UPI001CB8DF9E|nr:MTOR-associated protein MEAK7 isoform X2 [Erigeron canadensis]